MSAALRVGFLVSGLLHVAALVAVAPSLRQTAAPEAGAAPITLQLAVFQAASSVAPQPEPQPKPEPAAQLPPLAPPEPMPPEPPPAAVAAQPPQPPPPVQEPAPPPAPRPVRPSPVAQRVAARQASPPATPQAAAPRAPAKPPMQPRIAPAAPAPPAVDAQAAQQYLTALAARINRSKFYPRASRRLNEQGTVVVSFVIRRNGQLTDLNVVESSGYSRLDAAALETLRRLSPFEAIPDAVGRDQWPISVPLAFNLRP